MSIKINNPESRPALVYDKLHILTFSLVIEKTQDSKKAVTMVAVPYAVDTDGTKVFSDKPISMSTKDFDTDVMTYSLTKGEFSTVDECLTEYVGAMQHVSDEIAADQNIWHYMAHFEAALGKIFDVAGAASLDSIAP